MWANVPQGSTTNAEPSSQSLEPSPGIANFSFTNIVFYETCDTPRVVPEHNDVDGSTEKYNRDISSFRQCSWVSFVMFWFVYVCLYCPHGQGKTAVSGRRFNRQARILPHPRASFAPRARSNVGRVETFIRFNIFEGFRAHSCRGLTYC